MAFLHPVISRSRLVIKDVFAQLPADTPILLAVSGGADSLALASAVSFVNKKAKRVVQALVVDHQLRPESEAEAQTVQKLLSTTLDIPTNIATVEVTGKEGPEGAARRARYTALAQAAKELGKQVGSADPAVVFLGHNANDQAETVLLGLTRGSGARSLAGMTAVGVLPLDEQVPMRRPLLDFTHAQLQTICQELNLPYVEDPSNALDGNWRTAQGEPLLRARIRHQAIPYLEEILGTGIRQALAHTATLLRADEEALSELAQQALTQVCLSVTELEDLGYRANQLVVRCKELAKYPVAIRGRVLRQACLQSGARNGELGFRHLTALDKLIISNDNQKELQLPGIVAKKRQHLLEFTKTLLEV